MKESTASALFRQQQVLRFLFPKKHLEVHVDILLKVDYRYCWPCTRGVKWRWQQQSRPREKTASSKDGGKVNVWALFDKLLETASFILQQQLQTASYIFGKSNGNKNVKAICERVILSCKTQSFFSVVPVRLLNAICVVSVTCWFRNGKC